MSARLYIQHLAAGPSCSIIFVILLEARLRVEALQTDLQWRGSAKAAKACRKSPQPWSIELQMFQRMFQDEKPLAYEKSQILDDLNVLYIFIYIYIYH